MDGMFAYAVYDNQNNKLYYATDTQGEKNYLVMRIKTILFYHQIFMQYLNFLI